MNFTTSWHHVVSVQLDFVIQFSEQASFQESFELFPCSLCHSAGQNTWAETAQERDVYILKYCKHPQLFFVRNLEHANLKWYDYEGLLAAMFSSFDFFIILGEEIDRVVSSKFSTYSKMKRALESRWDYLRVGGQTRRKSLILKLSSTLLFRFVWAPETMQILDTCTAKAMHQIYASVWWKNPIKLRQKIKDFPSIYRINPGCFKKWRWNTICGYLNMRTPQWQPQLHAHASVILQDSADFG